MVSSKPSKTARKRENLALQELGERLISLDTDELGRMPIGARLRDAVTTAKSITSRGALRRQKQLIGRLMRNADAPAIRDALERTDADELLRKRIFRQAEQWRDRVLCEGRKAVAEFGSETGTDVATLDRLVTQLNEDLPDRVERRVRREVFREVHDALMARARGVRIPR